MKKLALEPQDILNKTFTIALKGYDAEEVDKMLDVILDDYYTMEDIHKSHIGQIDNMKKEITSLRNKLQEQILANEMLENAQKKLQERGVTNIDVIQRLARLEDVIHKQNTVSETKEEK